MICPECAVGGRTSAGGQSCQTQKANPAAASMAGGGQPPPADGRRGVGAGPARRPPRGRRPRPGRRGPCSRAARAAPRRPWACGNARGRSRRGEQREEAQGVVPHDQGVLVRHEVAADEESLLVACQGCVAQEQENGRQDDQQVHQRGGGERQARPREGSQQERATGRGGPRTRRPQHAGEVGAVPGDEPGLRLVAPGLVVEQPEDRQGGEERQEPPQPGTRAAESSGGGHPGYRSSW